MSWFDPARGAASYKAALLHGALAAAAVLVASPTAVTAQDVGDRVRVFLGDETLIGRVAGIRPEGFQLALADGTSRSVSQNDIRWLERDVAHGSNAIPWGTKGLVRGALGGGAIGFLLGLAVGPSCHDNECDFTIPEHLRAGAMYGLGYAAIGGVLGGVTGLTLGALNPRDEWQVIELRGAPVAIVPVVGFRSAPGGDVGVVAGIRVRFQLQF